MAARELESMRQLLGQLGAEFEKLQVWARSLHEENLRLRPVDASSFANGALLETSLQLQEGQQPALETPGPLTNGSSNIIELCPQRQTTCQTIPNQTATPLTQIMPHSTVEIWPCDGGELRPVNEEQFVDAVEEEACITEMRLWFQKLLNKEVGSSKEARALTPVFIESLFIETDGNTRRGQAWVANALFEFNHVLSTIERQAISLERSIVQRHMSTRKNVAQNSLAFDSFVELMIWKSVEPHLTIKQKRDSLQIREILIKNSIDELIYQYSGLEPPKQEKTQKWWYRSIEPAVALVILVNAITIGISTDYPWAGWEVCEAVYTSFFIFEIFMKVSIHGFIGHFCGPDMGWNLFDVSVVTLAVFDFGVSRVAGSESAIGNFTLMRLARLAKLTRVLRLIRLIRMRFFKELLLLIRGVAAGIRTLAWAFVLLASLVYVVGIMLRQTIGAYSPYGHGPGREPIVLFGSMRSSMFVVFRCFIGDCSVIDGTPLLAHLYELYGYAFVLPWALVTLFVTFGMFNLIMAVFVENVQENAKMKRELTRDDERATAVRRMRQLVMMFAGKSQVEGLHNPLALTERRSDSFGEHTMQALSQFRDNWKGKSEVDATNMFFHFGGTITRDAFNQVINSPEAQHILDDLEVHIADRTELFDLLDADGNRVLDLSELIQGILKLRSGGADKSDIVGTILGIRSLQKQLSSFIEIALEQQSSIRGDLKEEVAALKIMHQELRHDILNNHLGHSEILASQAPTLRKNIMAI